MKSEQSIRKILFQFQDRKRDIDTLINNYGWQNLSWSLKEEYQILVHKISSLDWVLSD